VGNQYGVAAAGYAPSVATFGSDVTLTAGTETTILSAAGLAAPTPGQYMPLIHLCLYVLMGATAPTALQFATKVGAGSDVDVQAVPAGTLVASATVAYFYTLYCTASPTLWVGAGSTLNVTGLATTTAATAKFAGSRAVVLLVRVGDTLP